MPTRLPKTQTQSSLPTQTPSRRGFLKGGGMMLAGGAIAGAELGVARAAHAFGSDAIRIGLVGCGKRGTEATLDALSTHGGEVKLVAMADVFENNLQSAYRSIKGKHASRVDLEDRRFVGLDAYKNVMASDADVVILATPPGFRPLHFDAAVQAGKHVFMEKPVATDAVGVRRVLATNQIAIEKGLSVAVGLQRRHEVRYRQCVQRIQDGAIGEIVFARAYWNGSGVWVRPRSAEQTELEYQLRNWYYFNWLSGDHIVEQHVHNLDVINWLMGSHPIEAQGQGGRQLRDGIDHGQIFDHHMVEYSYASGTRMLSQCRHMQGCRTTIGEFVHGTQGSADIANAILRDSRGNMIWQSDVTTRRGQNGYSQQHADWFAALRRGETLSEGEYGAHSTMTAIMGRMATYSGKVVRWDDAINSNIELADTSAMHSLADAAPVTPDADGRYPVPVPGSKTRIV
ncbi:oxidoreductase domain-containing protein [Rhodopirellula maiorica SM1]|uniref:Oxidoreductase domain-containing protein n=1 Tax=Rhodopirellula maiorica SM1 TaxID=1265738 RepID=M5RDU3_9BACT|nr:Gfo/Idh/MocA family oxidoreductase [Rhodopirellula maiorica]EMI17555.1 oxidoreductase domain-containing protein [Rhodopirellula maiorica SM1]